MEGLRITLLDLNPSAKSCLARQLRDIFEAGGIGVLVRTSAAAHALIEPAPAADRDNGISAAAPDVLFVILPESVGEADRIIIRTLGKEPGKIPIIAVLEETKTSEVIELLKLGITDFITPPLRPADVLPRLWRLAEHARKKRSLAERLKESVGLRQIIGASPLFAAELQKVPFVAGCDSSVLISGETGTGKEMFARAIHYLGARAGKPFTPVNCGAIPPDLIENELFGHARGAFTGAVAPANGIVHETEGGTLFLDEIDCLTLSAQVKLLRFLQEKEYRQLGSPKTRRADVRIIAATNSNLEQGVRQGTFRHDLYYRLNIIPLALPPLRQRREDVPLLVKHFADRYTGRFKKEVTDIASEAMQKLIRYDWPGNVRELQNVVERAVVFSAGGSLRASDIHLPTTDPAPPGFPAGSFRQAKAKIVIDFEKNYINDLLAAHRGNISQAAKAAGKNRRAFWELMRKHRIDTASFKPAVP